MDKRQSANIRLIAPHLSKLLSGNAASTGKAKRWPIVALAAGWLIAVIALAGPSWQKVEIPAVNLAGARVLVMDMSRSMYATDIAPNRLDQARFKALDMLPEWKEGSTGLVAYAGDGYIVSPLTDDASTLRNLIPNLSPEIMPIQGSNPAAGIQQAIDLLKQAGYADGDIVLMTDGMSQSESKAALNVLKGTKYRVSILAVGTQQGAPIKLPNGSLLEQNGAPVIAKLDLDTLSAITKETGGILQLWQPTNRDVENIAAYTSKPQDGVAEGKSKSIEERINEGFWLIIPLVLLTLLAFAVASCWLPCLWCCRFIRFRQQYSKLTTSKRTSTLKRVSLKRPPMALRRRSGKVSPNTKQVITKGQLIPSPNSTIRFLATTWEMRKRRQAI
ncbi:vWA domain-containing protein [Enterovibrio coralii]|uniref:vWA domain-containing protein n=1 Tax=Enterovibrio coralii TaxID=294935 RepID=UPI002FC315F2